MNEFVYELTLDLNCAKTPPVICSGQFDKGRKFEFTVTANGEPYDVTGCSAVLKGVRTDGSHFAVECSVLNGKIIKALDDTTLSIRGKTVAKLVISDSEKSYSTQMFIIDVDSALDGDITVADDYSILNRLIEQIHALNESGAILIDDSIDKNSNNAVANKAVAIALAQKSDKSATYTKTEVDAALNKKPDKATTLADYGITDGENIGNKVTDKSKITDENANYPSVSYLNGYYYDYSEVDDALSGKLDNTAGSVKTDNIASKAVTNEKIANGAITALKLANNAVSGSNIAQNQISTSHLQSGAVTIEKLSDDLLNYIKSSSGTSSGIEIVDSVDEMTDTSKDYVLSSTGTIWRYQETTITEEVTEQIEGDFAENSRLGSDGSLQTGTGYAAYVTTPFIDLLAYPVPFTLHLDGGNFLPTAIDSYTRMASYTENKTKITCVQIRNDYVRGVLNVETSQVSATVDGKSSITFNDTPKTNNANNDGVLKYVRFSGKGSIDTASAYVTYEGEVPGFGWVDTGDKYSGSSGGINQEVINKVSTLNNEGADPETVTLLPSPVLEFYNSEAYPDDDYTVTHLSKITYPCRADIPVPFTVKWNHNENAMRTTVALDTRAIGTVNAYTMITYDATGFDSYPIYNLLPNKTYYYKVTHVLSDGNLLEAKSGSFTTSTESIRLLYIDGTQNVRDLGGWTGLNGKKVKYGKLFRGASFSDSSFSGLMLTGKGRLALAELKVQAELNLGAIDTETSIASNCAYKKIYYTNYAIAITDDAARANFKTIFDWIVSCLNGTLTQSGLGTITRNVYMHCQGGCDRTGTLSFLLLGLLGVSESDLAKEYELSSFSDIGFGRLRTTTKAVDTYDYVGMVEALKTYSGATITDKFVNFATSCGISVETINSFRELMLE